MHKRLTVLDERGTWWRPMTEAARRRGYETFHVKRGAEAAGSHGLGFIRPHARPEVLKLNQAVDWPEMADNLTMVQDAGQVFHYDNKTAQFYAYGDWMPATWVVKDISGVHLMNLLGREVLVAKGDVGASSVNVHILRGDAEQEAFFSRFFERGLEVNHCAGGQGEKAARSIQRGHILVQEFVPHDVTYRVNVIGRCNAIFERYNHPDRPVAQTGNVAPVLGLNSTYESLLEYANLIAQKIGTKWAALDILRYGNSWVLLETSLAWPWPSPGDCMKAPFFGPTKHCWAGMWELLLDEYEAGVWESSPGAP